MKPLRHASVLAFVISSGILCGFGMAMFRILEILHLPTDTNEIVTVICILGKCISLP